MLRQSLSTRKCGAFSWSISQEVKAFLQGFGSRVGMTCECLGVIRELWDSTKIICAGLVDFLSSFQELREDVGEEDAAITAHSSGFSLWFSG